MESLEENWIYIGNERVFGILYEIYINKETQEIKYKNVLL